MIQQPPADRDPVLDIDALAARASARAGYTIGAPDVAMVLVATPVAALYAQHQDRVQWAVWDKETPINDVPAAKVLARADYNGGEIYLIWIDSHLTYLQPHSPQADAPLGAEVEDVAALHASDVAWECLLNELVEAVVAASTPPESSAAMISDLQALFAERGNT